VVEAVVDKLLFQETENQVDQVVDHSILELVDQVIHLLLVHLKVMMVELIVQPPQDQLMVVLQEEVQ
jgi:hypothetical protein